ncbi:MAG: phosphonopyruvate decarboxylase [Ruminococcus sp.]|nr:phosphonopyruvate decarboxylase [Ruminococcus sp.]
MIDVQSFCECLKENGFDFFAGVPDSLLSGFCACAGEIFGKRFIISANEGNAVGLAAGHYLAEGKAAVVFMQNSGIGNAVNPLLSLADKYVYNIPMLLIVGWRGEPKVKDEPQHIAQGRLTRELFNVMGIENIVLDDNYSETVSYCAETVGQGKRIALIVRKNTFSPYEYKAFKSDFSMTREQALEIITGSIGERDIVVSTTGKTSRELYELRERSGSGHGRDFLTVGSMGHASSIAAGLSLSTDRDVYCIDGDGAFLMHMGASAVNADISGDNYKYIIINNGSHESVGGQPTVGFKMCAEEVLRGCGFKNVFRAESVDELRNIIEKMKSVGKSAAVVYVKQGSRNDLGRPVMTPIENRNALMEELSE